MFCLFFRPGGYGQDCFNINIAQSKIVLDPAPAADLPDHGDSLKLPCNKSIINFSIRVDYHFNLESYFEDSIQMIGILMHKGTTYLMYYDKAANTFRLNNNLPNLGAGNYLLTVTSTNCTPSGNPCNNCTVTHSIDVFYNQDSNLDVTITSDPDPPVLSCLPDSKVTLTAPAAPNKNFKMQWARLQGNEFIKIIGATSNTFNATLAGTYQYILSGPGGCSGTNIITVSPPQLPKVAIQPDIQMLDACMQQIKGVNVSQAGSDPANIGYSWTTAGSGVIISGNDTSNPEISAPGIYTVVVRRTDNGCADTADVTILLGDIQIVTVNISKKPNQEQLDCRVDQITLTALPTLSSGTSGYEFLWSTGEKTAEINIKAPGTYTVTVSAEVNGCRGFATLDITQNVEPPLVFIQSSRDTMCAGETATLLALSTEPGDFRWGDNSINTMYTAIPPADGENVYSVTFTAADNGCTATAGKSIFRVPAPAVNCPDYTMTVENGDRQSLGCQAGDDELIWVSSAVNVRDIPALGAGMVTEQLFTLVQTRTPGSVLFSFYAKNAGCTSNRTDVLVLVVPKTNDGIFIPELITPDGNGMNDTWNIVIPDQIQNPEAYTLTLFSRNGAQVYQGTLAMTFQASEYPDGVYYYVLAKPDGETLNGAVTILRRQ